jgi:hypothetical protein
VHLLNQENSRYFHSCTYHDELITVVIANRKGLSLVGLNVQWKEPRVSVLMCNSSVCVSVDNSPTTPNTTPNAGNGGGTVLYEDCIGRRSVLQSLFQDTTTQVSDGNVTSRSSCGMMRRRVIGLFMLLNQQHSLKTLISLKTFK